MSDILRLLLILLGSLAISGLVMLVVIFDVSMNKLYKEEMRQKMLAKKTLIIQYIISTSLFFVVGYLLFV